MTDFPVDGYGGHKSLETARVIIQISVKIVEKSSSRHPE
jgi:hypothetical protein